MARRRRSTEPTLTIIYWSDIPAQVIAAGNGEKANALLSDRFQHGIDRAAAVAGKTDTEPYVAEWRKVIVPLEGDPRAAADSEAARLEAEYPRERLEALVANGGDEAEEPSTPAGGDEEPAPIEETP